ncbi:MAG: hypothetical protein Q9214_001653 [Letrouitia sp. 1 TL-2023]
MTPQHRIILTGAPLSSTLRFDEPSLSASLLPSFTPSPDPIAPTTAATPHTSWRSLPLTPPHLPTGFTPTSFPPLLSVLTQQSINSISSADIGSNEDFYDYSYELHSTTPSQDSQDPSSSLSSTSTSILDTPDKTSTPTLTRNERLNRLITTPLITDISSLPSASYLSSIAPQTLSLDLIVGLLEVPENPRTVTTRRGGTVDLLEFLCGDETSAGFGISMWLSAPPLHSDDGMKFGDLSSILRFGKNKNKDLRAQVQWLRRGDVVLMKNVGMSCWRGTVYGQSLRGLTSVDLWWRAGREMEPLEIGGLPGVHKFRKISRVADWITGSVGENRRRKREGGGGRLPEDTQ